RRTERRTGGAVPAPSRRHHGSSRPGPHPRAAHRAGPGAGAAAAGSKPHRAQAPGRLRRAGPGCGRKGRPAGRDGVRGHSAHAGLDVGAAGRRRAVAGPRPPASPRRLGSRRARPDSARRVSGLVGRPRRDREREGGLSSPAPERMRRPGRGKIAFNAVGYSRPHVAGRTLPAARCDPHVAARTTITFRREGAALSTALPERKDVPIEHTWDTASVFESDAAWEKAVEEATAKLPELARFKGRLGEGPAVLADWFDLVDELYGLIGKISTYAMLRFTVDTSDQQAAAINDRSRALMAQFGAAAAFAVPELLAVVTDRLLQWAVAI